MRVRSGLSPECKILGAIVVHTATVLSSNAEQPFLLPFVNMFSNPAALAVSISKVCSKQNGDSTCILECLSAYYGG